MKVCFVGIFQSFVFNNLNVYSRLIWKGYLGVVLLVISTLFKLFNLCLSCCLSYPLLLYPLLCCTSILLFSHTLLYCFSCFCRVSPGVHSINTSFQLPFLFLFFLLYLFLVRCCLLPSSWWFALLFASHSLQFCITNVPLLLLLCLQALLLFLLPLWLSWL